MKKILVNRVGFSGDILMATASLDAIKKTHPDCEITVSTWKQFGELLALNLAISQLTSPGNYMTSDFDQWWDVRHDQDMPRFEGDDDPLLYWGAVHARQAQGIGLLDLENVSTFRPRTFIGPDDCAERESSGTLTAINTFSTNGVNWRLWPSEKWGELVLALKNMGHKIVLLGSESDPPIENVDIDLRGKTRLSQAIGVLAICDLCIGIDSLICHMAHSVKHVHNVETGEVKQIGDSTPTVLLAGPIPPECVVPEDANCKVASYYPDCKGPCNHSFATEQLPVCEYKNSCMRELSIEMVLEKVEEITNESDSRSSG